MSKTTGISWTDHTFNPWWGCSKVSPACDHCYAERDAKRFAPSQVLWGVDAERRTFGDKHWAEPMKWNAAAQRDGVRRRVFCASMADVFDKNAPQGARDRLWQLIAATPALDWLLLTKRIGNAASMMPANFGGQGFNNVWLGATVVNQEEADRDIPKLLAVPARVRFLSIEPMLGPIDLSAIKVPLRGESFITANVLDRPDSLDRRHAQVTWLDWVIAGGESGPHARPSHPDWFRSLRDQCAAASVPFHFKQWGEHTPGELQANPAYPGGSDAWRLDQRGHRWHDPMEGLQPRDQWKPLKFIKTGKVAAGRLLDGVEHNGFPETS